jgi:hypothetical protein
MNGAQHAFSARLSEQVFQNAVVDAFPAQELVIGGLGSGIISDEELSKAVRAELGGHEYDQVILATGRQQGSWLARLLGRDPVHQLRRRLGRRLRVFAEGSGSTPTR